MVQATESDPIRVRPHREHAHECHVVWLSPEISAIFKGTEVIGGAGGGHGKGYLESSDPIKTGIDVYSDDA